MRAQFGEDPTVLQSLMGSTIAESVAFFLAAVRSGEVR
jgi:hypothetical protein